jgi:hypothetical protein
MFHIHSTSRLIFPQASKGFFQIFPNFRYVSKRFKGQKTGFKKPTRNALALELYKKGGYGKRAGKAQPKGDRSRLNIVSESLCGM